MALRGDLASVDLAQVFQMLALNKKVGLLSIQSAKLWKVLYFDQRGVTLHHNVHRVHDRVIAALVRSGSLTEATVDEVRDHAARTGQPLTDGLMAGGYVDPGQLADFYRMELEEEIYDLFFCKDARFEFHEGATTIEGRDGTIDGRFFCNCESVIMEAARRIDEWTYISERVPTTAEVMVATVDSIDPADYAPEGAMVFEMIDGRRNVARIVELTGLSNFQVCKVVSQMMDAGAVAPIAPDEVLPMAAQCMSQNRLRDAISLYERAIALGVGGPEVHSAAATAYQTAEEYEHAVYHLECEAEQRIAVGNKSIAAQKLLLAKQLVPTDLQARERLVELTLGKQGVHLSGFDAMTEGKELVELLAEFGDTQRVRTVLERLLQVAPGDPDLKKALVNVHVKAGDQKRVAELYESIADDLVRQGKPLEAIAYLQKILLVDRRRADISERVRKLYEFDERVRRRGRALVALSIAFVLLLALGCGYWFYNQHAEEEFARIDVAELVQREDFAAAAAAYQDFVRAHPFTVAVTKAEGELQQIEAARRIFDARRESERSTRRRELERLREEYQLLWARHREQFLAGEPEKSMESLTKVRELVATANTTEDTNWALERQVERTWVRLRDFLAEAQRLAAEFDRSLAAGDWEVARESAARLHKEFDSTLEARRVPMPILVRTRPEGAVLHQDGVPMQRTIGGQQQVLRTPTVVLCPRGHTVSCVAQLDGFEPRQIVVSDKQGAQLDVVMEVIASRRIAFPDAVQTGVAVGEGWVAVGVRGGRLGIARTDGSSSRVFELGGLRAVESTPHIQNGRAYFATNENTVECVVLDRGVQATGWPKTMQSGASTELMVADNRVAVVDRENMLYCWEQGSGSRAWSISLGSVASGAPTLDRRRVHVATTEGRVLTLDASDGRIIGELTSEVGITTRVHSDRGVFYFGCADGSVRAVDAADGRVLWTAAVGRTLLDGEMVFVGQFLVAIDASGQLVAFEKQSGKLHGRVALQGKPQRGLRAQGQRAFVQVRRTKRSKADRPTHDVVQAVHIEQMALLWEHADQGLSPGLPGTDDLVVAVPASGGEVILFR